MHLEAPEGTAIIRKSTLAQQMGVSIAWLDRAVKSGTFPRPIRLSARSVGWLSTEVDAWLKARAAERETSTPAAHPANHCD